jgi:hypothetical protein
MLELVKTETPQITVIPYIIVTKVRELLDERGISFKQVAWDDFEDGWPWGCTYRGEYYVDDSVAIIACVTTESLAKAAEDMFFLEHDDIKQIVEAQEKGEKLPIYLDRIDKHITEPFHPNLELTDTPEITIISRRSRQKVEKLLNSRQISYKIISDKEFPEDWPQTIVYHGKETKESLYAITACVSEKSLRQAAEDMYRLTPDEIQ